MTRILRALPLLAVSACTVGPDYEPPKAEVPPSWSNAETGGPGEPVDLARWWTSFEDRTLDGLVERAIGSNLDLKVAAARVREARAQRGVAASSGLPKLDASASYSRNRRSENAFGVGGGGGAAFSPDPEYDLYQAGFDASWEIDVFGGVRRSVEAADADIEASIEDRRSVLVTLLGEVGSVYIDVRRLQRQLAITRDNLRSQRETARLTRTRFDAGVNSELDVTRAEAQASTTASQIPALERDLSHAVYRLGVLLGRAPGALGDELAQEAPIPRASSAVKVGLPSDLLLRRPDIRRAERELAAATARIGAATAKLYPRFSLTGSLGLSSLEASHFAEHDSWFGSIGPSLRWPIFAGGRIRAGIEVQNARQEQALARFEAAVLTGLEDVENALVSYSRERVRRESLAEAAASNRRAVEIVRSRFTTGLIPFLDVLEAERSLNDSENDLAASEAAVSSSLVALYKALGGGWEVARS
jgi:outer membrane protein, multidrug efflux system